LNRLKAEQKVTNFNLGFEEKSLKASASSGNQKRMSTLMAGGQS